MRYAVRVEPGKKVRLGDIDPNENGGLDRKTGEELLLPLLEELGELQELLYSAQTHGLLIVLQGLDTSGKDGTIRSVFREVNPLGTRVVPFKVPSTLERSHDFLWRIHQAVPERGMLTIFNRSHYEDVLAVRIHDLVPKAVWGGRYEHINNFEQLLTDSHTLVLKFYLHIDKKEQEARLLDRERDVEKAWKLSAADWIDRRSWDRYQTAYEDALTKCNTEWAIPCGPTSRSGSRRWRNAAGRSSRRFAPCGASVNRPDRAGDLRRGVLCGSTDADMLPS